MINLNNYSESSAYDEACALYQRDAVRELRGLDRPDDRYSRLIDGHTVLLGNEHWVLAAYDLRTSEAVDVEQFESTPMLEAA